jgi:hypothetical protein
MPVTTIRGWVGLGLLLLGLLLIGWWLLPRATKGLVEQASNEHQPVFAAVPAGPSIATAASPSASSTDAPRPGAPASRRQQKGVRPVTPEASRWRERVLDSLRRREQEPSTGGVGKSGGSAPAPGTMVDRTGQLGEETMRVINHELLPMVGECYEQAVERKPTLRGMLALGVKLAGAEDVGGIVESVDSAPDSQIDDPELVECVRQSAFSIQLPPPGETGRNGVRMTIPLGIEIDAGP